jgi:hypothetical protein
MKWRNTKEREMMKSRHNQQKLEKNEIDSSKTVETNKCIINPQLSVENLTTTKQIKNTKTNEIVHSQNGYPPTNISLNCCTNHMPSKLSCNSGLLNSSKSPNSSLYISTSSFNSLSSSGSSSLSPISVENNSNLIQSESEELSPDVITNTLNSDDESSYVEEGDDEEENESLKIKHNDHNIKINCTDDEDESENDEDNEFEIHDENNNNNRKKNGESKIKLEKQ